MAIRKQDKMIIHNVALLGAVLSALGAGSLLWHLHEKEHSSSVGQSDFVRQAMAIDKLKQASELSDQLHLAEKMAEGFSVTNIQKAPQKDSFLASLSGGEMTGVVIAAAGAAGVVGYGVFWLSMWSGSMALYALVRCSYKIIYCIRPDYAVADKLEVAQNGKPIFQRNPDRILPIAIKLIVLLTLALLMLGIIVWQLTATELKAI
jgi:hypothetical protein